MASKQVFFTKNLEFIIAKEREFNCLQRMALQSSKEIASKKTNEC
jgi:hypothetical protein